MSERVRESIIASLLSSKRFVVALCAAVAMVLGAMSAGASVFTDNTISADSPAAANVVFSEAPRSTDGPPLSGETPFFKSTSKLTPGQIVAQPPQYTADESAKKGLNLKLNQDVVKAASAPLFYNPLPQSTTADPAAAVPSSTGAANAEPQEPSADSVQSTESTADPDTSGDAPRADPTTETGLNNVAPSTSEEQLKQ
jgi:hypothetical protein